LKKTKKKTEATTRIEDSQDQTNIKNNLIMPSASKSCGKKPQKTHVIAATTVISPKEGMLKKENNKIGFKKEHQFAISHNIDNLIISNIRKNKEKKEVEELKKFEKEERARINKEILEEHNRKIREMNARQRPRTISTVDPKKKPASSINRKNEAAQAVRIVSSVKPNNNLTDTERRAKLGLIFLDLQSKYCARGSGEINEISKNREAGKPMKPDMNSEKVIAIRNYMEKKKEKILAEKRKKKEEEKLKKAKIVENVENLKKVVNKIFSESQLAKIPFGLNEHKKPKKAKSDRRGKTKQDNKGYIHYLLPEELQMEERGIGTVPDPQLMDNIREELMNEMGTGRSPNSERNISKNEDNVCEKKINTLELLQNKANSKNDDNSSKIEKAYRGYLQLQKQDSQKEPETTKKSEIEIISPLEEQNLGKLLSGLASKSQNEKVVHLSRINTFEEMKSDAAKSLNNQAKIQSEKVTATVETQTDLNNDTAEIQIQTSVVENKENGSKERSPGIPFNLVTNQENTNEIEENKSNEPIRIDSQESSLKSPEIAEIRLLLGSEKLVQENSLRGIISTPDKTQKSNHESPDKNSEFHDEELNEFIKNIQESNNNPQNSQGNGLFNRNTFHEFTLKKLRQMLKVDNVSKLIGMREKVLKYKESTEKRYIQKMFKAKKLSPKTYQSKRKELEKWVTAEKEEIKKSKKSLIETWKKTANMIEEAHQNSLQIKKILAVHTMSYNSDTNSNLSLLLDSSRAATDRGHNSLGNEKELQTETKSKKELKRDISVENLSEVIGTPDSALQPKKPDENNAEHDIISNESKEKISQCKDFRELYESDSEESHSELVSDAVFTNSESQKETKTPEKLSKSQPNTAILIQDNGSPEDNLSQNSPPPKFIDPYHEINLPKSGNPDGLSSDSQIINNDEIGLDWEINLAPQKATNTRNSKNEQKHSPGEIPMPAQEKAQEVVLYSSENQQKVLQNTIENKDPDKEKLTDEITEFLISKVLEEAFSIPTLVKRQNNSDSANKPIIPPLKAVPMKKEDPRNSIGTPDPSQTALMQALAQAKHNKGIETGQDYIGNYVDDLFVDVVKQQKEIFINEINRSIIKPALDILAHLQSTEFEPNIPTQLPHEVNPIIPLSMYLDLEKRSEKKSANRKSENSEIQFIEECFHIHDKAIFDSVNEALNLIRPYGLNGEPMPWSAQGRILFKSIADPKIIIRNIKNMVLDWASFELGTLPKKEFLTNGKFDEDYFSEVREKQLATLLAQEVFLEGNNNMES